MTKALAVFVTLIAASMAAISAWDRGGDMIDRILLIGISVVIVLAVHLLPALSKRSYIWIVWAICLCAAIYGHLTFLTHASLRAGTVRAEQSTLAVGTDKQIQATQSELASIQARPIAVIAAALAITESKRERNALREELAEAKRAEMLKERLAKLFGVATEAKVTGTSDPVIKKLSEVTGYGENSVSLVIGLAFSTLLELIGALLWYEALKVTVTPKVVTSNAVTEPGNHDIIVLRNAIEAGECRKTVAGIRAYFKCSQEKAMELRREIGGFPSYQ